MARFDGAVHNYLYDSPSVHLNKTYARSPFHKSKERKNTGF